MLRYLGITLVIAMGLGTGCVETETPPNIPLQVEVSYGNRIYVVDFSRFVPTGNVCTTFGTTNGSTLTTAVPGFDTVDRSQPHNCFVPVDADSLMVDQVEITNDLFQFCVDSEVCERPDPSDANEGDVCADEDDFDRCPVVDLTRFEADNVCKFIGRRLPTMLEHVMIRQAGFVNPSNPMPGQMQPYINGTTPPTSEVDAILGAFQTRPGPVGPADAPTGAALNDVITGMATTGPIYDLTGNQTEWSSDGFLDPDLQSGVLLPWFCLAPLPNPPPEANGAPTCPAVGPGETAPCVYGEYEPPGLPYGTYPVCITHPNVRFSGSAIALAGGGTQDMDTDARIVGVFARRLEEDPEANDMAPSRSYGVRCVDDRPSRDANGDLQPFNFIDVNTSFAP